MAIPQLIPAPLAQRVLLSSSATFAEAQNFQYPYGVYSSSSYFITGAVEQVSYTYKKLGGDSIGIEMSNDSVFTAYEEACLEYSYLINLHQSKNSLMSALGSATGSFDSKGELTSGSNAALKMPRFKLDYYHNMAMGFSEEVGIGGTLPEYSASIPLSTNQQDYDIYLALSSSVSANPNLPYASALNQGKRIRVRRVYYMGGRAAWRFFAYYGTLNVVGNLTDYGQYTDGSTYEVVPAWQNKLQAMNYEDSIKTRVSHFSYEIMNNKIRIFPMPPTIDQFNLWFNFSIDDGGVFDEDPNQKTGVNGVNNLNTLPFANIPYENINSIGKHWIRRFALALSKEILAQVRGKFSGKFPLPGEDVTLNSNELFSQAKEEKESLREELKKILDETTYDKLSMMARVPSVIFVG